MRTSKKTSAKDDCDGETNEVNDTEDQSFMQGTKYYAMKLQYVFKIFLETEGWVIFVSLIMQDGPFFIIRIISIFYYNILTYTNYFFTTKNALLITLQVYRIVSIYLDHKAAKERELKQKRNLHNYKPEFNDYTDLIRTKRGIVT